MKPAPFAYVAPRELEEVLDLLGRFGEEAKLLAGGQTLMPMLAMRLAHPSVLIDLNRVEGLDGVQRTADGGLRLGAMTRHRTLETSPWVARAAPLLAAAAAEIGHLAIRNRGTLGGSLAHNHPSAELSAAISALEARIGVRSPRGERALTPSAFFTSYLTTDLAPDEVVTEVEIPPSGAPWRSAFVELSRRKGDFALVGVATLLRPEGHLCREARLALTGVGGVPWRAREAEKALVGRELTSKAIADAAQAVRDTVEPLSDLHGSADYRRHLAAVLTRRALEAALGDEKP